MSLEEIPSDTARRLLDFMSGIAFAMNGKITPVSAKTYFITPENVDLLDAQASPAESE
jgi:cell division inhibitor SepF